MNILFLFGGAKRKFTILLCCVLSMITFGFIFFESDPDVKNEENKLLLLRQIAELQMKVQYLSSLYELRDQDVYVLSEKVNKVITSSHFNQETEELLSLKNLSGENVGMFGNIRTPTIFNFLPHLLSNHSSLRPAYCFSKGRIGASVVMGIPTVKRPAQSYLISTLQDLLQKMTPEEKNDTVIVIFVAEVDADYVLRVANTVKEEFGDYMESGLLEIISPPASYYPDFQSVKRTLGDSLERVRWRAKQNLDFAFLMMYAYPKGMFYIQLEDDILAKHNFLSIMKTVVLDKTFSKRDWFVLEFCQLGFIGKMFRSVDLPYLIQFFLMFYNDKPVDWLLDGLIQTKACNLEKDAADCKKRKNELWVHVTPSLFQHIGTTSSLRGKVQRLKDKHFGKVPLFIPHRNPRAFVQSSITAYRHYDLTRAYVGKSFFWGLTPRVNDWISFKFEPPIKLKRFRFKSGNVEHPSDKICNGTVQASVSLNIPNEESSHNNSNNPFVTIGSFNTLGIADFTVRPDLGPVKEIRIIIQSDAENWIVLSEIWIQTGK